jgi:hypothetical protein
VSCADGPEAVHDWQPIMGWVGRYRCSFCRVIAHRCTTDSEVKAMFGPRKFEDFVPYVCVRKGCTRGAVVRKPRQLCAEHERMSR